MAFKRYIVELGMGSDLHGQDVTKAAIRAVRDAVSRSCLCGLFEIVGLKRPEDMHIRLHIACPAPDRLDRDAVAAEVPFGAVELSVAEGGMKADGLHVASLGEGDKITVALAALTVLVDWPDRP